MPSPFPVRLRGPLALSAALVLAGCSSLPVDLLRPTVPGPVPVPTWSVPVALPSSISIAAPRLPTYRVPDWWRPRAIARPNRGGAVFSDFHRAEGTYDGIVLSADRLLGRGVGRSVLRMRSHTSTHAADIPKRFPHTNQLSLVRLRSSVREFAGFTLTGTRQGHLYNGLRVDRTTGLRVHDVRILRIPGNKSFPPGETFGLNDYRSTGNRYARVEIDGKGVGAAGFGINGSRNITIHDSYSHNNRYSMGFAFWHVRNITIERSIAAFNGRAGFNFERVSGTVRLNRIMTLGNRHPITIASDQGSATYRIVDPIFQGSKLEVHLPRTYYGKPNKQRRGSIHLIIKGRDRSDLLRFS